MGADDGCAVPPGADGLLGGRYRLGARLGRGGAATVHHGVDVVLGREVAVKLYRDMDNAVGLYRFATEARLLAGLSHPGLVAVHDVCLDGDQPFLVMQLVNGPTLRSLLDRGPFPPGAVARLGARLADVLAYIHAHDIVHRDLKPANVLVDESGACRLADFGIARAIGAAHLTASGEFVGTAAYLAPEQVTDVDVGPPVDVYALGLVLLECLTGKTEYGGTTVESALARLSRQPRIPETVPPALRSVLTGMTTQDPATRLTAARCAELLGVVAEDLTASAAPGAVVPGAAAPASAAPETVDPEPVSPESVGQALAAREAVGSRPVGYALAAREAVGSRPVVPERSSPASVGDALAAREVVGAQPVVPERSSPASVGDALAAREAVGPEAVVGGPVVPEQRPRSDHPARRRVAVPRAGAVGLATVALAAVVSIAGVVGATTTAVPGHPVGDGTAPRTGPGAEPPTATEVVVVPVTPPVSGSGRVPGSGSGESGEATEPTASGAAAPTSAAGPGPGRGSAPAGQPTTPTHTPTPSAPGTVVAPDPDPDTGSGPGAAKKPTGKPTGGPTTGPRSRNGGS